MSYIMNLDWNIGEAYAFALRMFAAGFFGAIIGVEREYNKKPAGLRTLILICSGSALLVYLSIAFAKLSLSQTGDPSRIAAQVVTGIGFLGAGAIMHSKGGVVGLTTASTIWSVAGIGMACGAGFFIEASVFTVMVTIVLTAAKPIEHWISRRCHVNEYVIHVRKIKKVLPAIQLSLSKSHHWHQSPQLEVVKRPNNSEIHFSMCQSVKCHQELEEQLIELADSYDIRRG